MPRSQRFRLYSAEDEIIGPITWYASKEAMQADVDRFIARKWWKERCPVTRIDIEYPVVGSGAYKVNETHWRIGLSPQAANNLNLAHEKTHVFMGVTAGQDPEDHDQDHSAHFAGAEIEIVRRFCSPGLARRLKAEFEAEEVAYVPYREKPEEDPHEEAVVGSE